MPRDSDAPPKARIRRTLFRARRALSASVREEDALDGCKIVIDDEDVTPDDELDDLLEED